MSQIFCVLGAQRSGTNYLALLLKKNLHLIPTSFVDPNLCVNHWLLQNEISLLRNKNILLHPSCKIPHWKHSPPTHSSLFGKKLSYVAIVKNPYSWYISYKRFAPFSEIKVNASAVASIQEWNNLNSSYLKYRESNNNLCYLRYEDLVLDPQKEIKKVSDKYKIYFDEQKFIEITERVHTNLSTVPLYADDELKSSDPFVFYHDKLSSEDIRQINNNLDLCLMEKFNYSML